MRHEAKHRSRMGAGDEDTRRDVAGDGQANSVVAGSGDNRHWLPADAALAAALRGSGRNAARVTRSGLDCVFNGRLILNQFSGLDTGRALPPFTLKSTLLQSVPSGTSK